MGQRFEDENGVVDIIDDGIPGGRAPAKNFEDVNGNFTLTQADTGGIFPAPRPMIRLR